VNVAAALAPAVNPIANQTVVAGVAGSFAVSGSDPNVPASLPLTWSVTQSGPITLQNLVVNASGPSTADVNYRAPSVGSPTNVTVTVTAKNAAGVSSAPVSTTVTVNPAVVCVPALANTGGPYTVNSGASITLNGSAAGSSSSFLWTQTAIGTINPLNQAITTYKAPVVLAQTVVPLTLKATDSCGTSTATSSITVNAALPPTVNPVAPVSVFSGANKSFTISGADPNVPALTPLTFTVTQAPAGTLLNFTVTQNPPLGATVSFTAPTLPIGQVVPTVVTLTITDRNTAPLTSAPVTVTVTVNPLPDVVTIQAAQYRTGKQRLTINATSSVVSPNVVLKLQPYVTITGAVYNPDPAAGGIGNVFTNNLNGTYLLDITGAPEPACGNPAGNTTPCPTASMDVRSNLNGDSGPFALTNIRQ
jgi:hypothetical protein